MLNAEQKQAVEYDKGPLLIVAGAGTGKTTVIVEKIKHLISNGVKPENILALTFTEKAAFEMEERVDKALPYGYFQMWISTFHSFADKILREELNHIGLNSAYKLLTEAEATILLKKNLFLFNLKYFRPFGNPNKFLDALLQHFSRLRDEDVSSEEYLRYVKTKPDLTVSNEELDKNLELAKAYQLYEQIKIKEGFFDFSDLIYYLLKLFRTRKNILEKYRKQFSYILVDEFQDTNIAQYQLIKLLCPSTKNPHLTIVGDDSQAIYKFRGASVSNILTFMKDYPKAKQITLNKNYRSTQEILDHAYRLIKNNDPDTLETKLGISKELFAQKSVKKNSVNFFFTEKGNDEAERIAKEILHLKEKNNYKFSDFALLVRANNHADVFVSTFAYHGIPYRFLGPGMLYKLPEVKDLIAYLKLLYNIEDSTSLYRILSMDIFNIDAKDIALINAFAKKTNLSLFQAIEIINSFHLQNYDDESIFIYKRYLPFIKEETKKNLENIFKLINNHFSQIKRLTAGQILYDFLEKTGYLKKLVAYKTEKEEKIAINISKFFTRLKTYGAEHEDASVFAVVEYLEMSMELGESPIPALTDIAEYDAVNILTVHSAKGLEFPVVFLVNLTIDRFPSRERKETIPIPQSLIKEILPEGDYHLEEERRLFYVGLTRAMDKVYLSSSLFYGEGKRERKFSPFVEETLGKEITAKYKLSKQEEKNQLSIFDFKQIDESVVKERNFLNQFSFSQLETFRTCPLQYKYQYILKIPSAPSAAASFGDSIHKTLQRFYTEYVKDNSLGIDRALEIYRSVWVPLGYASSSHQERMKKEGEIILKQYFEKFHPPSSPILGLEKFFKIKINNEIYINGKIDRIDGNRNGTIEIIDYKTGKKPSERELKKSLQLSIYALAAIDKGLYNKTLNQVILTFYYFQSMDKITNKRTKEEIEEVKEKISETAKKINQGEFTPNPGKICDFCSYRIICEAWQ